MQKCPDLRPQTLKSILLTLTGKSGKDKAVEARRVIGSVWIAGEFCSGVEEEEEILSCFERSIGDLRSFETEEPVTDGDDAATGNAKTSTRVRVLTDGTYATETAISQSNTSSSSSSTDPVVRALLKAGFFEVGAVVALTLAKLLTRSSSPANQLNKLKARAMLLITSVIKFGLSKFPEKPMDRDSYDRIMFVLRSLNKPFGEQELSAMFAACRRSFEENVVRLDALCAVESDVKAADIDAPIKYSLLSSLLVHKQEQAVSDLEEAINGSSGQTVKSQNQLSKVVQLSGFSDPVYAETYVTLNHNDIFLDILLVNQVGGADGRVHRLGGQRRSKGGRGAPVPPVRPHVLCHLEGRHQGVCYRERIHPGLHKLCNGRP